MISIIRSTSARSSGPKFATGEALLFSTGSPNLTTCASAASRRSSISTSSRALLGLALLGLHLVAHRAESKRLLSVLILPAWRPMPRPRIAIATCAGYADLKVDDELLREALAERGAEARAVVWDEAGADWSDSTSAWCARPGTTTTSTASSSPGRGGWRQRRRCGTQPT